MKTAEQFVNEECAVYNTEALIAAVKARDRELVETCARAALPLPSDDDPEDPYHRIRALIPKEAP